MAYVWLVTYVVMCNRSSPQILQSELTATILCLSPSLSFYPIFLTLFFNLTHSLTHSLSITISLFHSLTLSILKPLYSSCHYIFSQPPKSLQTNHSPTHTVSLSLSLSQIHTHTRTHTHSYTVEHISGALQQI